MSTDDDDGSICFAEFHNLMKHKVMRHGLKCSSHVSAGESFRYHDGMIEIKLKVGSLSIF